MVVAAISGGVAGEEAEVEEAGVGGGRRISIGIVHVELGKLHE